MATLHQMPSPRVAICVKLENDTAQQLRAAAQFLRGYPHLLTLQDICEGAIEAHLDRLRGEHRAALKEHGGKFPTGKPKKTQGARS